MELCVTLKSLSVRVCSRVSLDKGSGSPGAPFGFGDEVIAACLGSKILRHNLRLKL